MHNYKTWVYEWLRSLTSDNKPANTTVVDSHTGTHFKY